MNNILETTDKALLQSRSAFFLMTLTRRVGDLKTDKMLDGQLWENVYRVGQDGEVAVAISDTDRNMLTDKKGTSRTPGLFTIELITTEPRSRNMGLASDELRQLIKTADKWQVVLRLMPVAQPGAGGFTDELLVAWYARHGFVPYERPNLYLVRQPKTRPLPGVR